MSFVFEIVHRAGKQNVADYISRQPFGQSPSEEEIGEAFINAMASYSVQKAKSREEIASATDADSVLTVFRLLLQGE